ncbi:hypothetical protein DMUE_0245 [Dictyocoela muelleri]|nr:hypothetical protein DMUE_0245 [Dictyocoela muelleri]
MNNDELTVQKFLKSLKPSKFDEALSTYMKKRDEIVKQLEIEEVQERIKSKILGTPLSDVLPIGFDEEYMDDSDIDDIEYGKLYNYDEYSGKNPHKVESEVDDENKVESDDEIDNESDNEVDDDKLNDNIDDEENSSEMIKIKKDKIDKTIKTDTKSIILENINPFIDIEAEISGSDSEDDQFSEVDSDLSEIIDENAPEYPPTIPIIYEDKELEFLKRKYELKYKKKKRKQKIFIDESSEETKNDIFIFDEYSSDYIEDDYESISDNVEYVDTVKPSEKSKRANDISFDK